MRITHHVKAALANTPGRSTWYNSVEELFAEDPRFFSFELLVTSSGHAMIHLYGVDDDGLYRAVAHIRPGEEQLTKDLLHGELQLILQDFGPISAIEQHAVAMHELLKELDAAEDPEAFSSAVERIPNLLEVIDLEGGVQ